MSTDQLRRAARRLRETAKDATPGPWGVERISGKSIGVLSYGASGFVADLGVEDAPYARADGAWIALAHPGLAGPLADWLEAVAAKEDGLRSATNADIAHLDLHPPGHASAIAIARVILGEQEDDDG